jgi:serine/threonine protein kinase
MSPEQVRADRGLDRRSDIFSLGIVLYELTTGYPLFRGDSDYLIAEQILGGKIIPPREVRPQYPEELQAIVMQALATDPADRFATARDLQLALEEFARARQLRSSSVGLSEYMTSLFPSQVGEWDIAQRSGQSLIEYVTSMLATRMTSSGITRGDDSSWFKRWAPAIALVALGAAVAGWVVAFQRSDATEVREPARQVQPAAQPTAGGQPTAAGQSASAKVATPDPVKLEVDAAPIEVEPVATSPQPIRKRTRLPKPTATPDAALAPTTPTTPTAPPGLDDRLNPFKPPDKDKPK